MKRLKDRELHDGVARQVEAQRRQQERLRLAMGFSFEEGGEMGGGQRMVAGEATSPGDM
jgi:hypothetical protein